MNQSKKNIHGRVRASSTGEANRAIVVLTFLLQHGLQGWCPPLLLFRALGIRTRHEIDEERYALKVLRGDFDQLLTNAVPKEILTALRN